jgi:hypothetical protein
LLLGRSSCWILNCSSGGSSSSDDATLECALHGNNVPCRACTALSDIMQQRTIHCIIKKMQQYHCQAAICLSCNGTEQLSMLSKLLQQTPLMPASLAIEWKLDCYLSCHFVISACCSVLDGSCRCGVLCVGQQQLRQSRRRC